MLICYPDFNTFIVRYLRRWKKFHEYWLTQFEKKLMVVLYKDLLADIEMLDSIVQFFGYNHKAKKDR